MPKTCEVCGRPIKTGRKYCWEHRHTAQARILQSNKTKKSLLGKAESAYIDYYGSVRPCLRPKGFLSFLGSMFIVVGGMILAAIMENFFIFFLGIILMIVWICILYSIGDRIRNDAINDVVERKPRFIEFAKGYVKRRKEYQDKEQKIKEEILGE